MASEEKCVVCGGKRSLFDRARIMGKYDVSYYRCESCGFINTEEPYWLEESYSSAIANSDIGILMRNSEIVKASSALFKTCFREAKSFLDWGGGYGIYVRMMRDAGFDFEWFDKYCNNMFANGYEKSREKYDIVTSFEMMEHVYQPVDLLEDVFRICDNFVFSTELNTFQKAKKVSEWWYYCTDHGQHVSIYTKEALAALADRFDKKYYRCGMLHIFSSNELNRSALRLVNKTPNMINKLFVRPSLLQSDYKALTEKGEPVC